MEDLDPARWQDLCSRVGLEAETKTFTKLQRNYAQRHRKYHNAEHINSCLAHLDASRHADAGNAYVEYALWFHDAIYNTHSSKNEERSADWAVEVLRRSGANPEAAEFVESLIMATCHRTVPTESSHQLLVDIDLSILGVSPERFGEFERQVRKEYWWVPRSTFRQKRVAVLNTFLERPSVYATPEFRERFEQQARANLERSVAELSHEI